MARAEGAPKTTPLRVQFDKKERAEAIRLRQLWADAQAAYALYLEERLKRRGIPAEQIPNWIYDDMSGFAQPGRPGG